MELFNRLLDTEDREEYIRLSMMLFPKMDRQEAEKLTDELHLLPENNEDVDDKKGGASDGW